MRRVQYLIDSQLDASLLPDAIGPAARLRPRLVGDQHRPAGGVAVQLQVVETVARGLANPLDLLLGRLGRQAPGVHPRTVTLHQPRRQADDLSLARGQGEQSLAPAAEEDRRVGTLSRLGYAVMLGDREVLTGERERVVGEAALEHGDRLGQARYPD